MLPTRVKPPPNVFVTGANGFLGSSIVHQASAAGVMVRATDQHSESRTAAVDYCQADILAPASLVRVMDGVAAVVHAAGLAHVFHHGPAHAEFFRAVNEVGTANVARAAAEAGVQHFVLVSSVSVYGGAATGVDETAPCRPEGVYAESKWLAEQRAIEIAKAGGMSLTILRLATLYGEGDPGNVARLMRSIDRGRFIWVGDGSNRKSLLHRDDAARACLAALFRPCDGVQVYNVSAPACTMREVVLGLASALGRPVPHWHIPGQFALQMSLPAAVLFQQRGRIGSLRATLHKWLADDVYSAVKYQRTFGFQTQVSLTDGLGREVAWYRGQLG